MVWLIPLLGLFIGIILGSMFTWSIPLAMAKYLSIAVLAALDSVLGGVRCILEETFNGLILLTGFVTNAVFAAFLAYLGDKLGVDLYMAAVFVFGIRIFQNVATIRHHFLTRLLSKRDIHATIEEDKL